MGRRKQNPSGNRMTQKAFCEWYGMHPSQLSRDWQKIFEKHGWPGFYPDGVDSRELIQGIREFEKIKNEKVVRMEGDPDERIKNQKSELLQMEIQEKRREMIYIPDFVDEIFKMQVEYISAQSRVPRTAAASFLAYIAEQIKDDIAKSPEVAAAFGKIKQGDVENWLEEKFSKATGDMGKKLKVAWENAIERARIRSL